MTSMIIIKILYYYMISYIMISYLSYNIYRFCSEAAQRRRHPLRHLDPALLLPWAEDGAIQRMKEKPRAECGSVESRYMFKIHDLQNQYRQNEHEHENDQNQNQNQESSSSPPPPPSSSSEESDWFCISYPDTVLLFPHSGWIAPPPHLPPRGLHNAETKVFVVDHSGRETWGDRKPAICRWFLLVVYWGAVNITSIIPANQQWWWLLLLLLLYLCRMNLRTE